MEQNDEMEKLQLDNDVRQRNNNPDTYVSCYPNSRRYSMASAMASNRPSTAVANQGYNHADDDDENSEETTKYQQDTKIEIPLQPPPYSPASDKSADKRIKVSRNRSRISEFPSFFIGFHTAWNFSRFRSSSR